MDNELEVVSIRLVKETSIICEAPIEKPEDAVRLLGERMCQLDREVICVINLKANGVPINCNFVSMGAIDYTVAHPREMLKSCILSNAAAMIILHNHPSGSLSPSKADTMLTDRMLKLTDLLGIQLLDHIIVGGNNQSYFSFKEKEMLEYEKNTYHTDYHDIDFAEMNVAETPQSDSFAIRKRIKR